MTAALTDSLSSVYREEIIELASDPECYGCLAAPDQTVEFGNRSCGDTISVTTTFKKVAGQWRVKEVRWEGEGCVISKAAASVVTQAAQGELCDKIAQWDVTHVLTLLGLPALSPSRQKCALVGLSALQLAVAKHLGNAS